MFFNYISKPEKVPLSVHDLSVASCNNSYNFFHYIPSNIAIKRSGNPSKNLSSGAKRRAEKFLRAGLTFGLISVFHKENLRSKKKLPLNLLFPDPK